MRTLLVALGMSVLVGGLVPGSAPAAPAAASIRCLQISPNSTPGSCTYKSTTFQQETLSAFTLKGWTLDWVQNGQHHSVVCTTGSCRNTPSFAFTADAGTIIHVTVTQGIVIVRQIVVAGRSI